MAKKAASKSKEVAKTGTSAVGAVADYSQFGGGGFENQDNTDILVPFLRVLQGLSEQVKSVKSGGVEGAQIGMIFNSVTEDLFDSEDGVLFVGSTTDHVVNEWVPRDSGGGFVGTHQLDSDVFTKAKERAIETEADFGKFKTENGNDLVETFYIYGVLCPEEGTPQPIIVDFTSTKIKIYKKWMSRLRSLLVDGPDETKINPPLFATLTRISTVEQTNKKGTFFNYNFNPAEGELMDSLLDPTDPRFQAALAMKQMVESGIAKADMDSAEGGNAPTPDSDGKTPPF